MDNNLLELTVARAIPSDVLIGLSAGQYKLDGGVIRWVAGTEHAGEIVRHLIPLGEQTIADPLFGNLSSVSSMATTYLVNKIGLTTQAVLKMATGNMVLAGLNLAVTAIGFATITQKLIRLENQLNRIEKEVKGIKELLAIEERARLRAALEDLTNAMKSHKPDDRRALLFHAKDILAPIRLKYQELLTKPSSFEVLLGYEEYFVLASLAHSRCLAELGMLDAAYRSMESDVTWWKGKTRKIASYLLEDNPQQFLFSDFVKDVPVTSLITWLNFAYDEEKGYERVDELRAKTKGWYTGLDKKDIEQKAKRTLSSFGQTILRKRDEKLEWQLKKVVPTFQKFVARNNVLDGYVAQYKYLEERNILPSTFEKEISNISPEFKVDEYLILEPSLG